MEMRKYGMSAMALLGALLLGNGQAQASETVNTILGGGVGGVAGTMIGKQLGATPAPWWGPLLAVRRAVRPRPTGATRMRQPWGRGRCPGRCRHRQERGWQHWPADRCRHRRGWWFGHRRQNRRRSREQQRSLL